MFFSLYDARRNEESKTQTSEGGGRIVQEKLQQLCTNRHTPSNPETTSRQPRTLREVERLCAILDITVNWYLTGQQPMRPIKQGEKERELLRLFATLSPRQQDAVLELIRVFEHSTD